MKRSPLTRRTPLARGGPLKRRTRLAAMSPKRRREQNERRALVARELARRPTCEAGRSIRSWRLTRFTPEQADRLDAGWGCLGYAAELHEPLTRARGGSALDPANTIAICRHCHEWIHSHPEAATSLGLLRRASDG